MKIFVAAAVLVLCVLLGLGFSNYYRRRRLFFESLRDFNLKFISCLEFSADPLAVFTKRAREGFAGEFRGLLEHYLGYLEGGEGAEERFRKALERYPLSREERERVAEYFLTLGGCDCPTERRRCSEYKAVFEGMAEGGRSEEKKNGALSVKLGVYLGLLVIIVLI